MKKYTIVVDASVTMSFVVEANSAEEAEEKMEEIIQGENFFADYRKGCDFFNPEQTDVFEEE